MAKTNPEVVQVIPDETIIRKIYVLRGQKVILDMDIAAMYGVENKQLKRQVNRNIDRFPKDFMFELNAEEYNSLRSQFGTLKRGEHSKYLPYAFTEQGVAMLSGVINSPKAVAMNIAIMRAFVEMRRLAISNKNIVEQIKILFERVDEHDVQLGAIYDTIENLLDEKAEPKAEEKKRRIGFRPEF